MNFRRLWQQDEGQDIAEYAVMLAVILVIVVGTIRLIGSNANTVGRSFQQKGPAGVESRSCNDGPGSSPIYQWSLN